MPAVLCLRSLPEIIEKQSLAKFRTSATEMPLSIWPRQTWRRKRTEPACQLCRAFRSLRKYRESDPWATQPRPNPGQTRQMPWSHAEYLASGRDEDGRQTEPTLPALRCCASDLLEFAGKQSLRDGAAAECRTNAIELPRESREALGPGRVGDGRERSPLRQPWACCAFCSLGKS